MYNINHQKLHKSQFASCANDVMQKFLLKLSGFYTSLAEMSIRPNILSA